MPPRLLECPAHIEGRVESVKWYGDECLFVIQQSHGAGQPRPGEEFTRYVIRLTPQSGMVVTAALIRTGSCWAGLLAMLPEEW